MARADKPKWRQVLNVRYLRWWVLRNAVRIVPPLGRLLGFFPDHVGLIEGADRVLANDVEPIPADEFVPHMEFLQRCRGNDRTAPDFSLPGGVITGWRTALYSRPWIDMATGAILLPARARTVLLRGETANWNATSARLNRQRVRIEGRAFAVLPSANYFHLLLENGVNLLDLLAGQQVADEPLTVVKQPDRSTVERALYQGIAALHPEIRLQHVPEGALVEPDEAVAHFPADNNWEWPPVTQVDAQRLATVFDHVYGPRAQAAGSGQLYLSRSGAKLRDARNAPELESALTAAGVETFVANDANHAEQIARFRAARTVVAIHGAGLANLVFCTAGTRVIEIFPQNAVKSTYWRLSHVLGLDYRPVIGGPGDYHQRFEVDVGAVIEALA